jgi:hypothetical protein
MEDDEHSEQADSGLNEKIDAMLDKVYNVGGGIVIGGLAGFLAKEQDMNTNSFSMLTTYTFLITAVYVGCLLASHRFFTEERKRNSLLNNLAAYVPCMAGMFGAYCLA